MLHQNVATLKTKTYDIKHVKYTQLLLMDNLFFPYLFSPTRIFSYLQLFSPTIFNTNFFALPIFSNSNIIPYFFFTWISFPTRFFWNIYFPLLFWKKINPVFSPTFSEYLPLLFFHLNIFPYQIFLVQWLSPTSFLTKH